MIKFFNNPEHGQPDYDHAGKKYDTGWIIDDFADQDKDAASNCNNWNPRIKRCGEWTGCFIGLAENEDAEESQNVKTVDGKYA